MSNFNLASRSGFAADRQELQTLLSEAVAQLEGEQLDLGFPSVASPFQRIADLALTVRLGFRGIPYAERFREVNGTVRQRYGTIDDPYGGESREIVIETSGSHSLTDACNLRRSARIVLLERTKAWSRAVAAVSEPVHYPCMPLWWPDIGKREHMRDPLYHAFADLTWGMKTQAGAKGISWNQDAHLPWIAKIHALMRHENIGDYPVFTSHFENDRSKESLAISHPLTNEALVLPLDVAGLLDDDSIRLLIDLLTTWFESRGAGLELGPSAKGAAPEAIHVDEHDSGESFVTLDQAAATAGCSKRTLEHLLSDGKLPRPDIQGGGGRSSTWRWGKLRTALEPYARRQLPIVFPDGRVLPP